MGVGGWDPGWGLVTRKTNHDYKLGIFTHTHTHIHTHTPHANFSRGEGLRWRLVIDYVHIKIPRAWVLGGF